MARNERVGHLGFGLFWLSVVSNKRLPAPSDVAFLFYFVFVFNVFCLAKGILCSSLIP